MWRQRTKAVGAAVTAVIIVSAVTGLAGVARAQSAGAKAEAEHTFREGKKLMQQGQYAEACAAFETSYQLESTVATLANVADCREKNGQLATAWALFREVAQKARSTDAKSKLAGKADERASALEQRLSYLTVSVPDESRVDGLVLTRNGEPLEQGLWNRAIPVDGGVYVIGGKAPGHEEWKTEVEVPTEHGRVGVDVPRFKAAAEVMSEPAVLQPTADVEEDEIASPSPGMWSGKRIAAVSAGGVAILAGVGGALLGRSAVDLEEQALSRCPDGPDAPCADADEANRLGDRAESRALYANVSFAVAGAAAVTAVVLWVIGAPEAETAPMVSVSPRGIDVLVRF